RQQCHLLVQCGVAALACGDWWVDERCPAMAIARYGEVCQRIIAEQSNVGRVSSVTHGQRAGRVVARISERGIGPSCNVSQVDHVSDCKLPADLAAKVRRVIDLESASGRGKRQGSRI